MRKPGGKGCDARASPDHPHNLPNPLTSFVGCEDELPLTRRLLREHRLVTRTGVEGVWFVDLMPLTRADPDIVAGTVAQILGKSTTYSDDLPDAERLCRNVRRD
jgi:hypothetical protein